MGVKLNNNNIGTYKSIGKSIFLIKMEKALDKINELFHNHKSKFKIIVPIVILIPVLTLGTIHTVNATKAYEVSMDGQYLCIVKTNEVIQEVLNEVKSQCE